MSTRRKNYRPRSFRDGGAVHAEDAPAPEARADEPPLSESVAPDAVDALVRVAESARRADDMQRQVTEPRLAAEQPGGMDRFIDQLPISDWKKSMLRVHPEMLEPARAGMVRRAHDEAMAQGIPDDSMQLYDFITRRLAPAIDATAPVRAEPVRPGPDQVRHQEQPPRRRSIPVGAPVTREVPSVSSGNRGDSDRTLSASEREIAYISFPQLSKHEAEFQYYQNRQRMRLMKARGELQE